MTRPLKILLFVLSVPLLILVSWLTYHETRVPQNEREVLNRMIELLKEQRYDKGAQIAQNWVKDTRRDASRDWVMYDQIAFLYVAKAYNKPGSRDDSVRLAQENLEKSLGLFENQNQGDISVELFEIGGAYERIGDISDKQKCESYEKARELYVRQLASIKGDSYTAYGKTILLEPVRTEMRKRLDATNVKYMNAGCQSH